jgi:hypothetical protein
MILQQQTLFRSRSTNKTTRYSFLYKESSQTSLPNRQCIEGSNQLLQRFIALNTKCGNKLKISKIFYKSFNYIYAYFNEFDHTLNINYPTYAGLFEFSRMFSERFYKADFLLLRIYNITELIFLIKNVRPKRKKKTKKHKQLKAIMVYLPFKKRATLTTRLISTYLSYGSSRSIEQRFGDSLFYLILAGRESFLYKKKLAMYTKILEKKKFY